jgi:hypothetical protein
MQVAWSGSRRRSLTSERTPGHGQQRKATKKEPKKNLKEKRAEKKAKKTSN